MSKYVKQLITDEIAKKLQGINDSLLVSFVGMDTNTSNRLRKTLAEKQINLLVVKNSLAKRALKETSLFAMFDQLDGSAAICWGCADVVSLSKEIVKISKEKQYKDFKICGGAMGGETISSEMVLEVSRWPSREEQISLLVGQIVGVGSGLSSQLISSGAAVASQIKKIADKESEEAVPTEVAA